jgi:predicted transcriptional regulator
MANEQLDLLSPPTWPYVSDSETSKAAAESMVLRASSDAALILRSVDEAPRGLTCDEVEVYLDLRHQTASARIRGLVQVGLLAKTTSTRPTRSGRQAVVYVITEKGKAMLKRMRDLAND